MKLNIKNGEEALRVPKGCIPLLSDADACDLRVLLYAAETDSRGEEFDVEKAAHALMVSAGEVNSSLKFWYGAGVLKKASQKAKKEEPKESGEMKKAVRTRRALPEKSEVSFTSNELCEIADMNGEFKALIDMAQQTAGWIFNTKDIEIIADLYSNLMLSTEYILALIGYFVKKREKPLRYIVKVANSFINDGIDSAKALEERLQWLEKFDGRAGKVRSMFGMGARDFSEKEKDFLADWFDKYKASDEMIKAAYEITVNNTGKVSFSYINKILENWYNDGVKKTSDIFKKEPKAAAPKTTRQGTATARSFNVDDALAKALKRSYKTEDKG